MRSAVELRQRWLDRVPLMIARAGMYTTGGGNAFDIQLRGLLADLCFLDEREQDLDTVHEVLRGYGKLGVVADGRVLRYAPADGSGWVFVDCYSEWTNRYVAGAGRYDGERGEDPLVRSVRCRAQGVESGLILTLYGKVLRWGPGWWLQQPSGLCDEQQAIAAQLRGIEAADPTQALKPSRGHPRREPGS